MRLGIVGAGGIATTLGQWLAEHREAPWRAVGIVARQRPPSARAEALARLLETDVVELDTLLARRPDWIVEAAGVDAARRVVPAALAAGVHVLVMSVGAMLDPEVAAAERRAASNGTRTVLPSGAIGGLDAVAAMRAGGTLRSVGITTVKAPSGLRGAPYLEDHDIALPEDRAITVFEGSAREAIAGFPANVNVAVALSIAGLGPDRTRVTLVSDPEARRTRHRIQASGDAGELTVSIEAERHPGNPRTSYLAALSAIATLKREALGREARARGGSGETMEHP